MTCLTLIKRKLPLSHPFHVSTRYKITIPTELSSLLHGRKNAERRDSVTLEILEERKKHLEKCEHQDVDLKLLRYVDHIGLGSRKRRNLGSSRHSISKATTKAGGFCTLLTSAVSNWPVFRHVLPEIAFAGHTNCGKSTLVNAISGLPPRDGPAGVNARAGWTDSICFYQLGKAPPVLILADLPGYGHAVASKLQMKKWNLVCRDYLKTRIVLSLTCVLVDCTRGLCYDDIVLLKFLMKSEKPWKVIVTKCDLLPSDSLVQSLLIIEKDIQDILDTTVRANRNHVSEKSTQQTEQTQQIESNLEIGEEKIQSSISPDSITVDTVDRSISTGDKDKIQVTSDSNQSRDYYDYNTQILINDNSISTFIHSISNEDLSISPMNTIHLKKEETTTTHFEEAGHSVSITNTPTTSTNIHQVAIINTLDSIKSVDDTTTNNVIYEDEDSFLLDTQEELVEYTRNTTTLTSTAVADDDDDSTKDRDNNGLSNRAGNLNDDEDEEDDDYEDENDLDEDQLLGKNHIEKEDSQKQFKKLNNHKKSKVKAPTLTLKYIIPISASTGAGLKHLWNHIAHVAHTCSVLPTQQTIETDNIPPTGAEQIKAIMQLQHSLVATEDDLKILNPGLYRNIAGKRMVREHIFASALRHTQARNMTR